MLDSRLFFAPPRGLAAVKRIYGTFAYSELPKGAIKIKGTWEKDNLVVKKNVCGSGLNIQLHRKVMPIFEHCLSEAIRTVPQYKLVKLGGYCSRRMMNDPNAPLSYHSWGCAFDMNWDTCTAGPNAVNDLPSDWVKVFTGIGWEWGGLWQRRDYMHFQFCTG